MEELANHLIDFMSGVPGPLIYVIAAAWLGMESAGIGLPIEPMMLFVGSLVTTGDVNLPLAVIVATLGCLVFASVAYIIGRRVGTASVARFGRFIGLNQRRAEHIELWLQHRGLLGVFIARETPIVRTFGSYIMGAADIPAPVFVLGTIIGSLLYCGVFIGLGALLGENYRAPLHYLDRIGIRGVLLVAAVIAIILVVHHFWGRLTLRAIAHHFHLHQGKHSAAVTAQSTAQ